VLGLSRAWRPSSHAGLSLAPTPHTAAAASAATICAMQLASAGGEVASVDLIQRLEALKSQLSRHGQGHGQYGGAPAPFIQNGDDGDDDGGVDDGGVDDDDAGDRHLRAPHRTRSNEERVLRRRAEAALSAERDRQLLMQDEIAGLRDQISALHQAGGRGGGGLGDTWPTTSGGDGGGMHRPQSQQPPLSSSSSSSSPSSWNQEKERALERANLLSKERVARQQEREAAEEAERRAREAEDAAWAHVRSLVERDAASMGGGGGGGLAPRTATRGRLQTMPRSSGGSAFFADGGGGGSDDGDLDLGGELRGGGQRGGGGRRGGEMLRGMRGAHEDERGRWRGGWEPGGADEEDYEDGEDGVDEDEFEDAGRVDDIGRGGGQEEHRPQHAADDPWSATDGAAHDGGGGGGDGGCTPARMLRDLHALETRYGKRSAKFADMAYNIGLYYRSQGQLDRARGLFADAADTYSYLYGEDHEETAEARECLADCRQQQQQQQQQRSPPASSSSSSGAGRGSAEWGQDSSQPGMGARRRPPAPHAGGGGGKPERTFREPRMKCQRNSSCRCPDCSSARELAETAVGGGERTAALAQSPPPPPRRGETRQSAHSCRLSHDLYRLRQLTAPTAPPRF
jgi:hypothetical protein